MTAVVQARGPGKRCRQRWALSDCTLDIPAGRVVGLVGPNGAGKTTLLSLAAGLLTPTAGTIEVCGGRPGRDRAQLARVGFVAQDTPAYARLTVADHLRLGARLSPGWDDALARRRTGRLGLPPGRQAGQLSGGQRAQLALTLAIAKRPELLILDEPVASLDPLARSEFLADLRDLLSINVADSITVVINEPGAWITSERTVNAAGQPARAPAAVMSCLLTSGPGQTFRPCLTRLARLGYRQEVSYEPARRFWALQRDETLIYLALAVVLAGLCTGLIRRRS